MFLLVALVLAAGPGPAEAKIEKQSFTSGGTQRTVYTFVPEKAAAAIAAHAGVLQRELGQYAKDAPRKLPIGIWVGTTDRLFPVDIVRATHTALKSFGYAAELTEIPRHTHDYYSRSGQINKEVWTFLQRQKLEKEPRYQEYAINK